VDDVVGPDKQRRTYATVDLKSGVAILAVDTNDQIFLTRQYRYAINKDSIEVVCGGVDAGDDPLLAAKTELEEEIGIQAGEWNDLGTINMDSSVIHCPIHLYIARQLTIVGSNQEGTEDIGYFKVSMNRAVEMVKQSVITHAASCVLIMRAHYQFFNSKLV
jgi:ADP-ribose pyrophosphatase